MTDRCRDRVKGLGRYPVQEVDGRGREVSLHDVRHAWDIDAARRRVSAHQHRALLTAPQKHVRVQRHQ